MRNFLYTLLVVFALFSCSVDYMNTKIEPVIKEKVAKLNSNEIVKNLLVKNGNDYEQLGRIFKCSVNTLKRVEKKETHFTPKALKEFRSFLCYVEMAGENDYKNVFKESDPYYDAWWRTFKYNLDNYFWWLLIMTAIYVFFSKALFIFNIVLDVIIIGGGYLLIWICNMLYPYNAPTYLFDEKINSVIELLF